MPALTVEIQGCSGRKTVVAEMGKVANQRNGAQCGGEKEREGCDL